MAAVHVFHIRQEVLVLALGIIRPRHHHGFANRCPALLGMSRLRGTDPIQERLPAGEKFQRSPWRLGRWSNVVGRAGSRRQRLKCFPNPVRGGVT